MSSFLGPLSSMAGSLTWALGTDVYSDLSKKYPPSVVNFSRATVAAPLFILAFLLHSSFNGTLLQDFLALEWHHVGWLVMSAIASYALGDLIFMKSSLSPLGPAGALAIASIYPLWAALIGFFFKGEHLGPLSFLSLIAVVLGTSGVVLSSEEKFKKSHSYEIKLKTAVLLAVITSLIWSSNIFAISHVRDVPTTLSNVVRMLAALCLCPLFGWLILGVKPYLMSKEDYRKSLPIFVLEGFGGSIFYIYGVSHSSMAVGSVFSSLAPVMALGVGYFRHGIVPNFRRSVSVVVIVMGLALLVFSKQGAN